ncbi:hypothetical protein BIW11_02411 [Tropilaelaps mercedesae]|uniref:Uncharacterized protein n=1 Tax=Tropilaelaps mercedesae TaxID=418985 RepID=A0A1V9Y3Q1_9ACAR|nr:hypothetical protein BIW11_02411 [Tropilaelaps mercedesae]
MDFLLASDIDSFSVSEATRTTQEQSPSAVTENRGEALPTIRLIRRQFGDQGTWCPSDSAWLKQLLQSCAFTLGPFS